MTPLPYALGSSVTMITQSKTI